MRKGKSRLIAGIIAAALVVVSVLSGPALAFSADVLAPKLLQPAVEFLNREFVRANLSDWLDWTAIAIKSTGENASGERWKVKGQTWLQLRENEVRQGRNLSPGLTSDYARTALGVLAAGGNPRSFSNRDLIQDIKNSQQPSGKYGDTLDQGGEELVNAHIWSMIALLSAGESPSAVEKARQWLKAQQHEDGGFHYFASSKESEVDTTAQAIVALVLAGERSDSSTLTRALRYLRGQQLDTGGFGVWNTENLESSATVLQALVALGIDPADKEWTKNGRSLLDVVAGYQMNDGSFRHVLRGKSSLIATLQAVIALGDCVHGETVYQKLARENAADRHEIVLRIGSPKATVNGQEVGLKSPPVIVGGRTLVPLRFIAEALGARVDYDPLKRQVTCNIEGQRITLGIGLASATVNGKKVVLDIPAQIISGYTMVPIKFVSQQMGYSVRWIPETSQVIVFR